MPCQIQRLLLFGGPMSHKKNKGARCNTVTTSPIAFVTTSPTSYYTPARMTHKPGSPNVNLKVTKHK